MEMNFEVYHVGGCYPEMAIQRDGCVFSWNNGMPIFNVLIYQPDQHIQTLADVDVHGVRLGAFTYRNVLTMAVKPGLLPWHDAPYNPCVESLDEGALRDLAAGGVSLSALYILSDSSNGRILKMSVFPLSEAFSHHVCKEVQWLWNEGKASFDYQEFFGNISLIQRRFSAADIGDRLRQMSFRLPADRGRTKG